MTIQNFLSIKSWYIPLNFTDQTKQEIYIIELNKTKNGVF
jgi:hypothetical protein